MKRGNDYDGTLIAIEGLDGSGKSTVVEAIETWAEDAGVDLITTGEPTTFQTGGWVYEALGNETIPATTDFMLFCADRYEHVDARIKPALERGAIVVTDRYADSTRAYQTHRVAEQMDMTYDEARDWMENVFEPWNIEADVTIYLDIPVDTAMERCDVGDKYERRESLEQVKEAYDRMYSHCDGEIRIIDGTQSKPAVRHKAVNTVKAVVHGDSDVPQGQSGQTYANAVREQS